MHFVALCPQLHLNLSIRAMKSESLRAPLTPATWPRPQTNIITKSVYGGSQEREQRGQQSRKSSVAIRPLSHLLPAPACIEMQIPSQGSHPVCHSQIEKQFLSMQMQAR